MLGDVESGGFLFGGDAQAHDLINDKKQRQRANDGDAPCYGDAGKLIDQLAPAAVDGAGGERVASRVLEDRVDDAGGEDAGEQGANGSAGSVNAKGVQRVVVAEKALDDEDHGEADDAGYETDDQCAHGLNKARGGSNRDQSGDCAGDGAQGGGLAVVNPLGYGPADGGGGSGKVGVDEGAGGQGAGGRGRCRH